MTRTTLLPKIIRITSFLMKPLPPNWSPMSTLIYFISFLLLLKPTEYPIPSPFLSLSLANGRTTTTYRPTVLRPIHLENKMVAPASGSILENYYNGIKSLTI